MKNIPPILCTYITCFNGITIAKELQSKLHGYALIIFKCKICPHFCAATDPMLPEIEEGEKLHRNLPGYVLIIFNVKYIPTFV